MLVHLHILVAVLAAIHGVLAQSTLSTTSDPRDLTTTTLTRTATDRDHTSGSFSLTLTRTGLAIPTDIKQLGKTENDVVNGLCRPTTLLFARGTNEGGNIGLGVGPPLSNALRVAFGFDKIAIQGIDYPADEAGAIRGSIDPFNATGAVDCAAKVAQVFASCGGPSKTRLLLSGYSQGAQQIHGCLMRLSEEQIQQVHAVVTFGDPLMSKGFDKVNASRTKSFCNEGDRVCEENRPIIEAPHFTYGLVAIDPAVSFIKNLTMVVVDGDREQPDTSDDMRCTLATFCVVAAVAILSGWF